MSESTDSQVDPKSLEGRLLGDKSKRPALLDDCVRLVDDEVRAKSGVSGMAIKGGYKVICKIKPGIIRESMDALIDDFVRRVEPFFAEHRETGDAAAFEQTLRSRQDEVAEALLGITDDRARRAKNATMKKVYEKLRPQAKKHVIAAIPGVAKMLSKHL